MAVDMFLKIDGIDGECEVKGFEKTIDIQSWSWGATQQASGHYGGGSGTEKASFQDLSITKRLDKSSPALLLHLSNGQHINKATLTCRKAAGKGDPVKYLVMTIEDIIVSSYQTGGAGEGGTPLESVTLNFTKFKYEYTPQSKDGKAGGSVPVAWDIKRVA